MKTRRLVCLLLSFLLVVGCLTMPAGADAVFDLELKTVITRATGQLEASIPSKTIAYLDDDISLDSGEVVTYNCTYTPKSASVKFGYIAPDGLFYGLSGSNGNISKGIRVSQRGAYTLAILNNSDVTVTVKGTVNY